MSGENLAQLLSVEVVTAAQSVRITPSKCRKATRPLVARRSSLGAVGLSGTYISIIMET